MSKNQKNEGKLMKIANIDREILHIFWTTWGNSMKFSGKMRFKILLKVTKKQGFSLSLEYTIFEKRVTTSGTTSDNECQRVTKTDTTSDNECQRVTNNDNEWYNEWQRMTTSDKEWYREWERMAASETTSDNKWEQMAMSESKW